jgi:hypothetical protein
MMAFDFLATGALAVLVAFAGFTSGPVVAFALVAFATGLTAFATGLTAFAAGFTAFGAFAAGFSAAFADLTTGFADLTTGFAAGFLVATGLASTFFTAGFVFLTAFGSTFLDDSTFLTGVFFAGELESFTEVFLGVAGFVIGVFSLTGGLAAGSLATAGALDLLKRPFMNPFLAGSWPFALSFPT